MDKEKSRDLTDMSETEIQHAERRHGGDFSGAKSRRTRRRQEKLGLQKTRGEESNETEEELHSMTEPEPLEEQTDGELEEVIKDPYEDENYNDIGGNPQKKKAWESWLENKAQQKGFNNQNTGEELDAWYGDLPSDQNDDVGEPTQARADEEFAAQRHEAGRSRGVKDTNVHFEGMHGIKKPRKNQYSESTAEASKAWEEWLKEKNFIFSGRRDRKTGKKKKVKFKEQYNLDDFESEKNVDKINLIYENKILPILGAIARGVGEAATEVGQGVAEGVKDGMTNDEEKEE